MERIVSKIPPQEILEWYISGGSGGKDGKGVAVRFNRETGFLEPDRNFANRVEQWRTHCPEGVDQYTLSEMPDLGLLVDYIAQRGVMFNFETGRLERTMQQNELLV